MKVLYCNFNPIHKQIMLDSPIECKDSCGWKWNDVDSFKISQVCGKSVYVKYMRAGLPLFEARKVIKFVPCGNPESSGDMRITVAGKQYTIGTWESKEEII